MNQWGRGNVSKSLNITNSEFERVTQRAKPAAAEPQKQVKRERKQDDEKLKKDGIKWEEGKTFSPHSHFLNVIVL